MERDPVQTFADPFKRLRDAIAQDILGQRPLVEDLLVAALARGHVLVEGAPGLGKTRLVRAFADATDLSFGRVQFTPDLMPADVTGSTVFVEEARENRFVFNDGRIVSAMTAIGVPVRDADGRVLAALSIASIRERMDEKRRSELSLLLRDEALELARALASRPVSAPRPRRMRQAGSALEEQL
jgi:transcriptional regulator of acetoin/glycerol metabolism